MSPDISLPGADAVDDEPEVGVDERSPPQRAAHRGPRQRQPMRLDHVRHAVVARDRKIAIIEETE